MNGFWIMIALLVVGGWFSKTADCHFQIPGACEAAAKQYQPSTWIKPKTEKEP